MVSIARLITGVLVVNWLVCEDYLLPIACVAGSGSQSKMSREQRVIGFSTIQARSATRFSTKTTFGGLLRGETRSVTKGHTLS